MLTVNAVNFNNNIYNRSRYMSFGNNQKVGVTTLDKNSNTKINFQKDLAESKNADMVQSNPIKALAYNVIKAYNILCTPTRRTTQTETTFVHLPYMA